MGHRLLHQSHASGRIGAFFARSKDTRGCREKVEVRGNLPLPGCPKSSDRFAILRDSARYPSGRRERTANPPFVGSNPTRASKLPVSNQWIKTFSSFPENPQLGNIWEQLRKGPLPASRLRACVCLESHACRSPAWSQWSRIPIAAARSTPTSCKTEACMWRSFMPRFEEI